MLTHEELKEKCQKLQQDGTFETLVDAIVELALADAQHENDYAYNPDLDVHDYYDYGI